MPPSLWSVYACHTLNTLYLFQLFAQQLHVVHVADVQPYVALENSILVLEFELLDVHVHLLRSNLCNLIDDAYAVDAFDVYGHDELVQTACVPAC